MRFFDVSFPSKFVRSPTRGDWSSQEDIDQRVTLRPASVPPPTAQPETIPVVPELRSPPITTNASENCCVFVAGLPKWCSARDLVQQIRGCGNVYEINIKPANEQHRSTAAQVIFWEASGATRLIEKCSSGSIVIASHQARALRSMIRVAPRGPSRATRVLIIKGPSVVVNRPFLESFVFTRFDYSLEEVVQHTGATAQYLEYRFVSFRGQAERAMTAIQSWKARRNLMTTRGRGIWEQVEAYWGQDPCA
ncbi:hypothetical protein F5B20DRAFT_590926 [Whalleya microplaca]|nr:hypothetical protein F5B20DRAFT_590926 [Whalleya microplaca]